MPATIEAAILFVLLVAPGYLSLTAYNQFNSESAIQFSVLHIAQSIPVSILILGLTWWPLSGDLVGKLSEFRESGADGLADPATWYLLMGLFAVAFAIGALLGSLIKWAGPGHDNEPDRWPLTWLHPGCKAIFTRLGIYEPATTWEEAARWLGSARESLIKLQLSDGSTIYGPFAEDSRMTLAPRQRGMYLEQAFFQTDDGKLEKAPGGAFIIGDQVVGIYILERKVDE